MGIEATAFAYFLIRFALFCCAFKKKIMPAFHDNDVTVTAFLYLNYVKID